MDEFFKNLITLFIFYIIIIMGINALQKAVAAPFSGLEIPLLISIVPLSAYLTIRSRVTRLREFKKDEPRLKKLS